MRIETDLKLDPQAYKQRLINMNNAIANKCLLFIRKPPKEMIIIDNSQYINIIKDG